MTLPSVVLIPGSFRPASSLEILRAALKETGFDARLAELPSSDPKSEVAAATATCGADAAHVRKTHIQPLLDESKNVIIFAHSYGGIVAGGAACGLKLTGKSSVIGLVLHSAMLLSEGSSLESAFGGQLPPFILQDEPSPGVSIMASNDQTPHATVALKSPAPKAAWAERGFESRLVYIRTIKSENTFNTEFQDRLIAGSGAKWIVKDIHGTHEAYETHTDEVVAIIQKYAAEWSS